MAEWGLEPSFPNYRFQCSFWNCDQGRENNVHCGEARTRDVGNARCIRTSSSWHIRHSKHHLDSLGSSPFPPSLGHPQVANQMGELWVFLLALEKQLWVLINLSEPLHSNSTADLPVGAMMTKEDPTSHVLLWISRPPRRSPV